MVGPRRRAREIALQVLYQLDVNEGLTAEQGLATFQRHFRRSDAEGEEDVGRRTPEPISTPTGSGGSGLMPVDQLLVEHLVMGVMAERAEVDELISHLSRNWRLERMAVVDRNVLRVALYELRHSEDVPVRVIMNEAIELAKRFGSAEAGAFVNGLLDRAVGELNIRR